MKVGDWTLGTKRPFGHAADFFSVEKSLERMEQRGIDRIVFSQSAHMFMYWAGDYGTEFARISKTSWLPTAPSSRTSSTSGQ